MGRFGSPVIRTVKLGRRTSWTFGNQDFSELFFPHVEVLASRICSLRPPFYPALLGKRQPLSFLRVLYLFVVLSCYPAH